MLRTSSFASAGLAIAFLSGMGPPAAQAAEAASFKGKTITVVVGSEPNGGFDTYGRVFARFLRAHLPGRPVVIVKNMPGAGSLVAVNYIYNVAPRDGTEIAVIGQVAAINQSLGKPGVHYDVRKLTWVGRLTSNSQVMFAWRASGVKTIKDAMTHQVVVAGTSAASTSVVMPRIMNDFLGAKFKIVRGYKGSASAILAVERGEAEAAVRPWNEIKATNPDWLRDKKINPLVQFAPRRDPDISGVPTVLDLASTRTERQLFGFFVSGGDVGYAVIAPPGLAAPVTKTLRTAFDQVMKDPRFIAQAQKERLTLDPAPGAKLQTINDEALKVPENILELAKKYDPSN